MGEVYKIEQHRYAKEERWNDLVVRYEADTIEGVLALEAADVANKAKLIVLPKRPETVVSAVTYSADPSRIHDESRDLVWNVPNEKGETVERHIIPAGKWARTDKGIRVLMPGLFGTSALIPLAEVEYHNGEPLPPIMRGGVAYPANVDEPHVVENRQPHHRCPHCDRFVEVPGHCGRCPAPVRA